jgi:hypothetical protein
MVGQSVNNELERMYKEINSTIRNLKDNEIGKQNAMG